MLHQPIRPVYMHFLLTGLRNAIIDQPRQALPDGKALHGLIPICSPCAKKFVMATGAGVRSKASGQKHTQAGFSHAACPQCLKKDYPRLTGD